MNTVYYTVFLKKFSIIVLISIRAFNRNGIVPKLTSLSGFSASATFVRLNNS